MKRYIHVIIKKGVKTIAKFTIKGLLNVSLKKKGLLNVIGILSCTLGVMVYYQTYIQLNLA